MRGKNIVLVVILCGLSLVIAGCGGAGNAAQRSPVVQKVLLMDGSFKPQLIRVEADIPIRFVLDNEGDYTHEFRILTEPPIYKEVAPQSIEWLDAVFTESGDFEFVCTLNNNDRRGMRGGLIVETIE